MNDAIFLNNFIFNDFRYQKTKHTDNSHGVEHHFIGKIKHGRGLIETKTQTLEIPTGSLFYIPKGLKYHSHWIAEDGDIHYDSIGFLYFPTQSPNGYALQTIPCDEMLAKMYQPLSDNKTINNASVGQLYCVLSKLEQILQQAPASRADAVLNKLLVLMEQNTERAIAAYAEDCGVSEAMLYLYVKQKLNKTPNTIRQEVKCRRAVQLLQSTNLSVEQVCDRCGFSSASYFRKVLFAVMEKTPSEIRRAANQI